MAGRFGVLVGLFLAVPALLGSALIQALDGATSAPVVAEIAVEQDDPSSRRRRAGPSPRIRTVPPTELREDELVAWRQLLDDDPGLASPFLTPAWAATVAAVRPSVRVAVVEQGTPSFLAYELRGRVAARPVGWPMNAMQAVVTGDLAAIGPFHRVTAGAKVHLLAFDHLREEQAGLLTEITGRDATPEIDLSAGYEAYLEGLRGRSKLVAQLGRLARKVERELGEVRFVADERDHRLLDTLVEWKRDQFVRTGAADLLAPPANTALLHRVLDLRDPDCCGNLSVLYAGDRPIAMHLGLRTPREFAHWFQGYDRELAQYSPGNLHVLRLVEALAASGAQRLDFGKGGAEYKERFKTGDRHVLTGRVTHPVLANGIRGALSARSTLKRLPRLGRA
ncbi:MAG: GNAT family N-acetyltransferase [Acidimicrobiia bacterium]